MRTPSASDMLLEIEIGQLLRELPFLDSSCIQAVVVGRVCRLRGTVRSYEEKRALERALAQVQGLRATVNQVRIAPEGPAWEAYSVNPEGRATEPIR